MSQPKRKFQKELNAGTVGLVILSVLKQHRRAMYGYELARLLQSYTDELPMNQAAIYPVLRSLEKQELLSSEMVPSDAGPPRKYYQLTEEGHQAQQEWAKLWQQTQHFVERILETAHAKRGRSRGESDRESETGASDSSSQVSL